MPDYDPKNIPVLDDIIEDEVENKNEATTTRRKIILSDEISADENSLDLFSEATTDIKIDDTEPEIGIIDKVIDDDIDLEIETLETQDDESNIVESALIDYSFENDTEDDTAADEQTVDQIHPSDEQINHQTEIIEPQTIIDPAIALNSIVDDIVTQLIPDLELQLHSLVKKALREKLPKDLIRQISTEDDD